MKIAITSVGPDLDSQVDPRFGRSPYFILVDSDTDAFESMKNPNVQAMGGAGIQSAQLIANKGAEVLLTGSCGPNAFQTLSAAGVKIITGVSGTIKEAVENFKSGKLQPIQQPNVESHYGVGYGAGRGIGMGRGMGMGMGMGMGRGRGMGMGRGMFSQMGYPPAGYTGTFQQTPPPTNPSLPGMDKNQELAFLKEQAEALKHQIEQVTKRIKELEKKG